VTRPELLAAALVLLDGGPLSTTDLLDGVGVQKGPPRRRAWRDLNALQGTRRLSARRRMVAKDGAVVPVLFWSKPVEVSNAS